MNEHLNAEEIKAFQALLSKDEGRSEMVQLFKLLGDATRLNIITLLTQREPLCVEDLMNCTGMEHHHVLELYNLASEHCCEEHSA